MSAETKAQLEAAIEAHVMNLTGDHTAGWVLIAECTSLQELADGEGSFFTEARDYQSSFLSAGLIQSAYDRSRE